jgi:DNA gyrase/topoisomerase IV subunit A
MGLGDKEKILKIIPMMEGEQIWVISEMWKILIFQEGDVRAMGKTAWWVKAIDLEEGDKLADIFRYQEEPFIFVHDGKNGKLISAEDVMEQKARGRMKRGQSWVIAAVSKKSQKVKLKWAIAITEWAVNLALANWRVDLLDSDKMKLKLPTWPLDKITNNEIVTMYRPYAEKEEARTSSS